MKHFSFNINNAGLSLKFTNITIIANAAINIIIIITTTITINITTTDNSHLAHVIHASVDDDPSAEDVVHAGKGELGVLHVDDGHALLVRQYVSEVPHVSVGVARRTVVELECFYL